MTNVMYARHTCVKLTPLLCAAASPSAVSEFDGPRIREQFGIPAGAADCLACDYERGDSAKTQPEGSA